MFNLQPAEHFLYCFRLKTGVQLLLGIHFVLCLYTCSTAVNTVVEGGKNSGLAVASFGVSEVFNAIWSLLGVPTILVALWGTFNRLEPHVRLYYYYFYGSCIIDLYYIVDMLIFKDSCVHLKLLVDARGGKAFACGVARGISGATSVTLMVFLFYMLYVLWSFCEELTGRRESDALADLLMMAEGRKPLKRDSSWMPEYCDPNDMVGSGIDVMSSISNGARVVYGSVVAGSANAGRMAGGAVINEMNFLENNLEG
eukprot:TRINITY_DN22661_c0_g1_i1.p1 TRINITY_DN22661_c0_g1~~TRINITY_DN22661_c0_g1_i1.p1  ORF type:complete len:255 (-),score=25.78 TRINITY_DN22661_c0_g1_i1:133-897(-)